MIIPPEDATTIHDAIPGSVTDGQGNFAFPCTTNANLAVSFAGKSFSISPKDYVGVQLTGSTSLCQSNIVGQQVGGPTQWLMGDVFLKNVPSFSVSQTNVSGLQCLRLYQQPDRFRGQDCDRRINEFSRRSVICCGVRCRGSLAWIWKDFDIWFGIDHAQYHFILLRSLDWDLSRYTLREFMLFLVCLVPLDPGLRSNIFHRIPFLFSFLIQYHTRPPGTS